MTIGMLTTRLLVTVHGTLNWSVFGAGRAVVHALYLSAPTSIVLGDFGKSLPYWLQNGALESLDGAAISIHIVPILDVAVVVGYMMITWARNYVGRAIALGKIGDVDHSEAAEAVGDAIEYDLRARHVQRVLWVTAAVALWFAVGSILLAADWPSFLQALDAGNLTALGAVFDGVSLRSLVTLVWALALATLSLFVDPCRPTFLHKLEERLRYIRRD